MYKKSLAAGVLNARCANFMETDRVATGCNCLVVGRAVNASVRKSDFTITFSRVSHSAPVAWSMSD